MQIEIYLLIKYIKSVLWREAKCLSYKPDARCVKVKYFEGSDTALHIFKTNNPKPGYSSNVITIKNVYISYKIFCAMLGRPQSNITTLFILGSLGHSTLRKGSPLSSIFPRHNF